MLNNTKLLVEFQYKAIEAQAYICAQMRKGLVVVKDIINKISEKLFQVEYRISLEEAYIYKVLKVYDYIKTQGYKIITYVVCAFLLGRQDKFMPIGYKGIFMSYNKYTTIYYYVYISDMYTTMISSNIKFFEDLLGSSINNYQLQVELSDGLFKHADGTFNKYVMWNKRECLQG